jgi:hypothetical protein
MGLQSLPEPSPVKSITSGGPELLGSVSINASCLCYRQWLCLTPLTRNRLPLILPTLQQAEPFDLA